MTKTTATESCAPQTIQCQCGEWSGSPCRWEGTLGDTVVVEYMPAYLRASHTAAGNRGIWPHNGAMRLRVSRDCADTMIADDGEWCAIVEDESFPDESSNYEASLTAALVWAADASEGDYLVQYEDTGLTDVEDPGSRCGYDDSDLDAIRKALAERDLTLTADDRGLVAQAMRP